MNSQVTFASLGLAEPILRAIGEAGGVVQAVAYYQFVKDDPARVAAEEALQGAQDIVAEMISDSTPEASRNAGTIPMRIPLIPWSRLAEKSV